MSILLFEVFLIKKRAMINDDDHDNDDDGEDDDDAVAHDSDDSITLMIMTKWIFLLVHEQPKIACS